MIYYFSPSTLDGGCERKITLTQQGWRTLMDTNDMVFGEACHLYLALRANDIDQDEAHLRATILYRSKPKVMRIKHLTDDKLHMVLMKLESDAKKFTYHKKPDGKVAVEFSLSLPPIDIDPGTVVVPTGTLDGIVKRNLTSSDLSVLDRKTTCKIEPDLRDYKMSHQFLHYAGVIKSAAITYNDEYVCDIYHRLKSVIVESIQFHYRFDTKIEYHEFEIDWQRVDYYMKHLYHLMTAKAGSMEPTGILHGNCISGKDYACPFISICRDNDYSLHRRS